MHRSTNRRPTLRRTPSTSVIAVLWLPLTCLAIAIAPQIFLVAVSSVAAQTSQDRKAEADRLLQQGIQQYQRNEYQAALDSWEQALLLYRAMQDRNGEV